MRKICLDGIKDDFLRQLDDLTQFHETGLAAFTKESDRSTLTEYSLLAAAVAWEGFVSDMFIAYINRDPARFMQHLDAALKAHVEKCPISKKVFDTFGTLTLPTHLKKADVEKLANGGRRNITFRSFAELEGQAEEWLVPDHAAKFRELDDSQKAVVDSVIALRNHIAHRSQASSDAVNKALECKKLEGTGLQRGPNRCRNVGAWLKATPDGGKRTRLALIIRTLREVGGVHKARTPCG